MNSLAGKNVLVVEDDEDLRDLLFEVFCLTKATVQKAENGRAAFELLGNSKFDIVITDIRMPHGDGIELAEKIGSMQGPKPMLFVCSGFNDISPEQIRALNIAKAFDKPFDHKELIRSVIEVYQTAQ